jgi:hypothetical protein
VRSPVEEDVMLRTAIPVAPACLLALALAAMVGPAAAATPWVETSLGFTTYDLSDVNGDLTDPVRELGLFHDQELAIDGAFFGSVALGAQLGRWSVGVHYVRLPASVDWTHREPVNLVPGQLATDAIVYDADAQAFALSVDRFFGEARDNPRVVFGVAAGLVSTDGELGLDLTPLAGDDRTEYRAGTSFTGTGFYGDAHLRVHVDLGRIYLAPTIAFRYAAGDVDDFDETIVRDAEDRPIFTLDTLDYTGMVFQLGVGYTPGR